MQLNNLLWATAQDCEECCPKVIRPLRLEGEWLNLYAALIHATRRDYLAPFAQEVRDASYVYDILEKRIFAYGLNCDSSGIIMCLALGRFNPGRSLLALVESAATAQMRGGELIDQEFIDLEVYPLGFYSDTDASVRFDVVRTLTHFL
jgi:hypothetical protein